ncbi:MAG TPA: nickel-dependent hydrogenase large subunit [Candidatus Aquicultor sp.]|jgi:hydrogenase large subunit
MAQKIKIDPVTRIEGHLGVTVEIENGKVKDAWSEGNMFRGLEVLLKGRDPRDASYVTDRVCGVCSGSHNWASALALDDAFGADVPDAGRLVRNLILGAMWLHDHPLHFYHLSALDYIDVMAVAKYKGNDPGLKAVRSKIVKLVQAGDTAPLTPRYAPDEWNVSDPELVTTAVAHYLQCLEIQAKAKRMAALLGGKIPHNASIVVGGTTMYPTMQTLDAYRGILAEVAAFVKNVYVKDVVTFGTGPLLKLATSNVGVSGLNYLSYGGFQNSSSKDDMLLPAGAILGNLGSIEKVDPEAITEHVAYSWYDGDAALQPAQGETAVNRDKDKAYSFIKAPRYQDKAMEVGPLARMLVAQNETLMGLVEKGVKPGAVARHAARALETLTIVDGVTKWLDELTGMVGKGDVKIHDDSKWNVPDSSTGKGLTEAPRGALGHWINIKGGKIENYQLVVPGTWNMSPRDKNNVRGPMEQALIGAPVPDAKNPNNVVRIIRSFDPCISCAVHIIEPKTNEILKFQIG